MLLQCCFQLQKYEVWQILWPPIIAFLDRQKSLIPNIKILYKCLLRMFLNRFITLSVFFHSFTFIFSDKVVFIFCNMYLLILRVSFFAGFIAFVFNSKNFAIAIPVFYFSSFSSLFRNGLPKAFQPSFYLKLSRERVTMI